MILYGVPVSPFVQRVMLAARAKGAALAVTPPPGGLASAEFGAVSPMRRVPVLVDGALAVCESMAIVQHLDEALPGPSLLPDDAGGRAKARAIALIADGEVGAGLRPFIGSKAFRRPVEPATLAMARAQLDRGLDAIEQLAATQPGWLAGERISIADVALAPLLILAEILEGHAGLPPFIGERPALRAWTANAFADPLVEPTAAAMRAGFIPFVTMMLQQAQQQQQ